LDDLQALIKELESEKGNLLRLIDEAVKEQEFLHAHFHYKALSKVNGRLQTLRNLEDESYDRKFQIEHGIENLRKIVNAETDDFFGSMTSRQIEEMEEELRRLNQLPKKQINPNGKVHLRESLDQFVKGKIRGLRVTFSRSGDLKIEIRRTKMGVRLTIPNLNKLKDEYSIKLKRMRGLGFLINKKGSKATAILNESKDKMTNKIMTIISLIVFEVFYFKMLDNEGTIEILAKRTGANDVG